MMSERTGVQETLFYGFSLEQHVPDNHLLRSIDRLIDLSGIREHLRPFYSTMGRPSIDPELLIRMLLIGLVTVLCRSGSNYATLASKARGLMQCAAPHLPGR
jgi:transposase